MLTHIHIKNFVIVSELELEFHNHLNVLTGETGAGKSIWVDALGLALGNRSDGQVIREGETRCEIAASFDLCNNPAALQWLQQHELNNASDNEAECIIRRVFNQDRSSRSFINGSPCPQSLVSELANLLESRHSQHQHQALLNRDSQQRQVDQYAKSGPILDIIFTLHTQWKNQQRELDTLLAQVENKDNELNLLQYQSKELAALELQEGEWQNLHKEHQRLHNAKSLITELNQAIELAGENEQNSAAQLLQAAISHIDIIYNEEPQLQSAMSLLKSAAIHLEEANNELTHYRSHLDLSPDRLKHIEERLSAIHELARKHHVNPEDLHAVQKSLAQKIARLEACDTTIDQLRQSINKIEKTYLTHAKKLTALRQKAATIFDKQITEHMQLLGIEGGKFRLHFEHTDGMISPLGNERVNYVVSTNPGQAVQPIGKVVSGGELSRISLAIQVLTAGQAQTPTLIFDEVDTGIGGKTAEVVGKLLRTLSATTQILCITHLPQVAAQGQHHYKAHKFNNKKVTTTTIVELNKDERIEEIARMLAGSTITQQAKAHAKELLAN